ncbi:MAG TPA: PIN domain-containing protein [Thermomicrobiales bacterium]|nr:PIN domain-containing protein [Thermomicrobiales bacterium]
MIDSDLLIDYVRGIPATVAHIQQLQASGEILCTCDVVIAEVESGLSSAQSPAAQVLVDELVLLERNASAARQAGRWRYDYARKGIALSTTDTLIAATALAHAAAILTRNVRHYPMPELSILRGPTNPPLRR